MDKYNGMKKAGDWMGRSVITTCELRNGWGVIPAGTTGVITKMTSGRLSFQSNPCNCCGVQMFISRVDYFSFKLDEEQ